MHCHYIHYHSVVSSKWFWCNFYQWGKWVKKHVQGHPVKLRFESQGHPWYSDSKACELGNTTCSSRAKPAPASQHLWSPVVSTSWHVHDTSLSLPVSLSLTSSLFLSAIASPFHCFPFLCYVCLPFVLFRRASHCVARTNLTPYWFYSFSSNLCALLPALSHGGAAALWNNIPSSLKYTA